ncbi:hypothetical protein FWH30_01095, partial [Microgenomates group bacterium]|nr:hypothetical protein [Microgenomates group bacterium]
MSFLDIDYDEPVVVEHKTNYSSLVLFFIGAALFIGGLGFYAFARLTKKPTPETPPLIYSSKDLTDEEILGSIATDFNLDTG